MSRLPAHGKSVDFYEPEFYVKRMGVLCGKNPEFFRRENEFDESLAETVLIFQWIKSDVSQNLRSCRNRFRTLNYHFPRKRVYINWMPNHLFILNFCVDRI